MHARGESTPVERQPGCPTSPKQDRIATAALRDLHATEDRDRALADDLGNRHAFQGD